MALSRPDGTKVTYTIDVEEEIEEVSILPYISRKFCTFLAFSVGSIYRA
jgi:hypothetical protein